MATSLLQQQVTSSTLCAEPAVQQLQVRDLWVSQREHQRFCSCQHSRGDTVPERDWHCGPNNQHLPGICSHRLRECASQLEPFYAISCEVGRLTFAFHKLCLHAYLPACLSVC